MFTAFSNQGTIRFSGNEQGYKNVVPAGEWNTLTAVLDYSKGTVNVNQITINGNKMDVDKNRLTSIDNIDDLLHDSALGFYFSGENEYTYVDYIRAYKVEKYDNFIKADGTPATTFTDAVKLNIASYDVAVGECMVIAYYDSENRLVGTDVTDILSEDLSEGAITRTLNKPSDAVKLKVFVFESVETLEPSDISPILL